MKTRRAIVTGGNSGIGRATVLRLAHDGWNVAFTYAHHDQEASATADEARDYGIAVEFRKVDFSDPASAEAALSGLIEACGGVDLIVNNAATNPRLTVMDLTVSQWQKTIDVNTTAALLGMQLAAQAMAAQGRGGCIINITSVVAGVPQITGGAYCASKAALRSLTQVAALEFAPLGIRVLDVEPGYIATRMNFGDKSIDPEGEPAPLVPLRRSGSPDEVAATIAFLASDEARYVTGSTHRVDGGLMLFSPPQALQAEMGVPPASE